MISPSNIATGFIAPLSHAVSNIIDSRIGEVYHTNLTFLLCISALLQGLLMLPVLFWLTPTLHITITSIGVVLFVAAIEFFYVYPYFWSLKHADTSVVAALFSLGKIIVPLMAWLFLGEVLQTQQYLGCALIFGASLMLTFNPRKFHFNRAAGLMLLASLLLVAEGLVLKGAFEGGLSWVTLEFYCIITECIIALTLLTLAPRRNWAMLRAIPRSTGTLILIEGIFSGIGNAGASWALAVLPVTIAKALSGTQPLVVLAYAGLFSHHFPNYFKENQSNLPLTLKIIAFSLMILGTIFTLGL